MAAERGAMGPRKLALLVLAEGAEEMEAVIVADVLRRAKVEVCIAGLESAEPVVCSRAVRIVPDVALDSLLEETKEFDLVVLPGGGPGAQKLCKSETVGRLLKSQESSGRLIGAVCAAPLALQAHGIGKGKNITSYPAFKEELKGDYDYQEEDVVCDGQLITSRGPGTCFKFALTLAENLMGKDDSLASAMLL